MTRVTLLFHQHWTILREKYHGMDHHSENILFIQITAGFAYLGFALARTLRQNDKRLVLTFCSTLFQIVDTFGVKIY